MEYSVGTMCDVLGICRSAYYRWTDVGKSDTMARMPQESLGELAYHGLVCRVSATIRTDTF
jgi:hypothetical protein